MRAGSPVSLTVVVLAHDEEANLPTCLHSLEGLDCQLVVVDSGSTDRTVAIAQEHGARVLTHVFESHARQWQWALTHLPGEAEWVLGLDADQWLTPELKDELARLFTTERVRLRDLDGLYVTRRQVFRGRWISHGGYYPKYLLKLFRPRKVLLDERDLMDHHFYVAGRVSRLHGDLVESNAKEDDIFFWIQKHNRYAVLHAREEVVRRGGGAPWPIRPTLFGNPDQRTLWLKVCWYHLPLYVRPFIYFIYRYIILMGFLDGKQGFLFHFLQAFWYRLLVDVNIDQLRTGRDPAPVVGQAQLALPLE